jgi:NodT family efflux transporter outer membrane factor (OMF) lipoprotein
MSNRPRYRRVIVRSAATVLVASLCGCTVTPPYQKPDVPVPDHFVAASANETQDLDAWWRGFADPQLQALVTKALQSNLDLRSAVARVRQAREQEVIAGAAQLPSVGVSGAGVGLYSKSNPLAGLMSDSSSGSGSGGSGSGGDSSTHLHVFALAVDATWEVDVFGGVRSSIEAARANTEVQVWQVRDGEVSLTAEVANDYLTLRALQARRAMLLDSIAHEEELLQLASDRLHAGLATELDVNQERTQLARDQAELPQFDGQFGAIMNALAVLLGEPPGSLADELAPASAAPQTLPAIGIQLPPGLPSDLLRRRPDVRAAERRLAAATGEVGVAVAKLYPSFDLIGAASLASGSLHSLLDTRNFAALGLADVMWPVFAAGKLQANVRANEAARDAAYLAYQNSVLGALQDAETAIIRCSTEERRLESLQKYVSAATSSAQIAADEYRNGIVDFTTVLSATDAELAARDSLVQSRQTLAQARISLFKALGGGWTEDPERRADAKH